ncbi:MAG TPA: SapC family protein [Parvularculaceae bacterium]|nr:SapC family protein [Parvularculaceae bacterium]HNS85495.1 SapC family protein [Parvularculaceae bacterium]
MSQTPAAPQINGKMFLFEKPELLSREHHGKLGLDAAKKPFSFCAHVRAIPLTISEVVEAAKHYPVVFYSQEEPLPIAILGFNSDINLFVDEEGNWEEHAYIPGYLRRYPFALAGETGGDRYALVLDAAYEGLSAKAERKLFENNELSAFAKSAMEFTTTYETDRRLTDRIMKELKKLDIIHSQTAQYTPAGETAPRTFAQYFGIDEQHLNKLTDEQFLELRKMNVLPVIYAHLVSLNNWRSLIGRRMKRLGVSELEAVSGQRPS